MSYEDRILIPIVPTEPNLEFRTHSDLLIATGYERVVIGGRGPYVEFSDSQLHKPSIVVTDDCKWRFEEKFNYVFYYEYRSIDECKVKLYFQRKEVDYADYKVGMWYVSPYELTTDKYPILFKTLKDTSVCNLHKKDEYDVYCGRAGKGFDGYFGNPKQLQNYKNREECLEAYKTYFYERLINDKEFKRRIHGLKGKRLGCFCAPELCHVMIIIEYLDGTPVQEQIMAYRLKRSQGQSIQCFEE